MKAVIILHVQLERFSLNIQSTYANSFECRMFYIFKHLVCSSSDLCLNRVECVSEKIIFANYSISKRRWKWEFFTRKCLTRVISHKIMNDSLWWLKQLLSGLFIEVKYDNFFFFFHKGTNNKLIIIFKYTKIVLAWTKNASRNLEREREIN